MSSGRLRLFGRRAAAGGMSVCVALSLNAASTGSTALLTPQGTDAGTATGDYVSDTNALNTSYHYWVEVPPGLTTLTVDVFDPDIGLGGATEETAGRDRDRGGAYDGTAAYSIFKPNGTARTASFATGTAAAPAASDNAWTTLFTTTPDTVRDNFAAAAYTNNNGVVNWTTNWTETNDDNNAGAGLIQITGGELRIRDDGGAVSTIEREANTSTYATTTLTFTMRTENVEATDVMLLQASGNGGGAWTTIATYTGAFASTNQSYDISAFEATNTRIRFIESANYTGTDSFFVDNVQIADSQITPGHWEVRVDMSSAADATADDINALGLRAHDGNSTSGGTELNMYVDGIVAYGVNPPNSGTTSRTYQFYPWVTSGCSCLENDFDYDSNEGNTGSMTFTARAGGTGFTQSMASTALSGENAWNRDTITGFTTDQASVNYGIWDWDATITSYVNGAGQNGNYTTAYVANATAAANPPTANPPANSFRVYFPTDGGAAPAKPYIEQLLASRGAGLLQVGVPHRYTVTVRMENPTSRAITFSTASNIVTANIPGSGTVYGGNAQTSQGTIVSQPAVGGTGNITFNPGTLAAGGVVTLSYDVTVTATSAGQRILVTGSSTGANGTRAQYVDETGNTTQARATNQVGPICELAVTEGLITDVLLSSFTAAVKGNKTSIEWNTAAENGTIGFNVYRVDAARNGALVRVNERPIAANVGAPQGGRYRLTDKDNGSAYASYVLEELTAKGKTNRYGPFAATSKKNVDPPANGSVSDHQPRGNGGTVSIDWLPSPKKLTSVAVMAGVNKTGVVRVAAADVASMLNMPVQPLLTAIQARTISVTNNGKPVAWSSTAANDAILFYGEKGDTIFSNDRVYRIELGTATPMSIVQVAAAAAPLTTFEATRELETDAFAATVLPLDPNGDYWFWDYILSGDPTDGRRTFNVNIPSVASAGGASLQVRLQGAQAGTPHRARVSLNGAPVGEVTWSSIDAKSSDLALPAALLRDGANDITVEGVLEPGTSFDVFYIDGFSVRYQRKAIPEGAALQLTPPADRQVTAGPFATLPLALDITSPLQPRMLQNGAFAGGNLSFVAPAGVQSIFIAERSAFVAPSFLRGSEPASLMSNRTGADYVVITPAALRDGAQTLANFRASDGLQTLVVDLDQIYDEFNGGNPNPSAIRSFIAFTSRWSRRPKYFVLIGGGTIDYRGIQTAPGPMPPMMFKTSDGLYASDSLYADRNLDNVPDVAIGRIPVNDANELNAYLQKLSASTRTNPAASKIVWSADAVDRGASFRDASLRAEAPLASRPATRVYLDELGGDGGRAALLGAWQTGTPLVNWIGHGGLDRLSSSSILTVDDAPTLTSSGPLPVVVAMTCTINRFDIGVVDSLGAALTRAPNAGALAVWSSSGMSVHGDAQELGRTFLRLAVKTPNARIGDLVLQSITANPSLGESGPLYLLLGDPALRLSLPAESAPTGPRSAKE